MKRAPHRDEGFTMLEFFMVVMVITVLTVVWLYAMKDRFSATPLRRVKGDISGLQTALMMYRTINGFYPSTKQGLSALVKEPESEPRPRSWSQFFNELPKDPWKNDYFFQYPASRSGQEYDIYSAGPNRKPGDSDDIGNWKTKT